MLTVFISNKYEENDWGKIITLWLLFTLPVLCFGYSIYAYIMIFRKRKIQQNVEFRVVIIKFLIYSALFIVFYIPTPILFLITKNTNPEPDSAMSWFAFVRFFVF